MIKTTEEKNTESLTETGKIKISMLIPCYNEEKTLRHSIRSWLVQSRMPDEIIVVDDSSTDNTPKILREYKSIIKTVRTPKNTGNKSTAQEYGLQFVVGDIMVTTDGDTILDKNFIARIEEDFSDPSVSAVGGYVKSLKYNWLTACRALDYAVGQNIDKLAQDYINYMLVIPGAAGAFRVSVFKTLGFDHDTLTEDLDFTYKLHSLGHRIKYDREAICYTQDPASLKSYINQMRRWFGGGWQNFIKHMKFPRRPGMALELSLIYGEGFVFSILLFILPIINIYATFLFLLIYFVLSFVLSLFGAVKERRWDLIFIFPHYVFLKYIHAYIYLEQFVKEVVLKKKNLIWFQPERVQM